MEILERVVSEDKAIGFHRELTGKILNCFWWRHLLHFVACGNIEQEISMFSG